MIDIQRKGEGRFFGVERIQCTLSQGAVENARGAAYVVWGMVCDRCDGMFVRYVGRKLWSEKISYV